MTQSDFIPDTEGVWLDLDAETYHKAPGISQSRLKEFAEFASPLHYLKRKPKAVTADMEFGTICHTAILEPLNLPRAYHLKPETYPSEGKGGAVVQKPWNGNSNWCQQWLETHTDRPVITKDREPAIARIAAELTNDPQGKRAAFTNALRYGQREASYFQRDAVTGLLVKCRCDVMATDGDGITWIFDLKKVQSGAAGFEDFQKTVLDRGYHIQAASYLHITGASRFVIVSFDDDEPFDAIQWEPDADILRLGLAEYRSILNRFAVCVKSNEWPGYHAGISPLTLPYWAKKRLEELVA